MNSLAFFKPANDRQIKKERFYRTSTHVDLRLCKLPASEIPPFSRGHENGANVVIKNKGAIVLWVKIAKIKARSAAPFRTGPILSLLPIVIIPERKAKNGKPNGRNICQVLF